MVDEEPHDVTQEVTGHPERDADETTAPGVAPREPIRRAMPREVGEYVIEAEVARGGMGVVYHATHRKIGRSVALKMILSGAFASGDEIERFYREAASTAKLDHPGIVPIYEVGEHDGQPYFSMKFIEGATLAEQMNEVRSDIRRAVQLLADVARAVHFAHQHGVLHRDLKPANILIDRQSGQPYVVDFGLARPVQGDSGLTRSGAVVGTPSYMPPEQAHGSEATTASDVYSLGAILFELLAGQPPFREDSSVKTLMALVSADEPPSPSDIDPRVDRDLEAVVAKAMAFAPEARYASAAELAEDLERWLAGEPLSVRPPSVGHLLQLWIRQNMRSAVGALVVGTVAGLLTGVAVYTVFVAPSLASARQVYDQLGLPTPFFARSLPLVGAMSDSATAADIAQYGLPIALALVGFVNALVVRPKTRTAAVVAGSMAGFMVALVSFAVGIGWLVTSVNVVNGNTLNTSLVARAAWDDQPSGGIYRQAMFYRYPALENMTPRQRSEALIQLIASDAMAAIPIGLWGGMAMVVGLGLIPCVGGTLLAADLLAERQRWPVALLMYSETVVAFAFFILFLLIWYVGPMIGMTTYRPAVGWQAGLLGALLAAGVASFRRAPWWQRVPLILASCALFGIYLRQAARDGLALPLARRDVESGNVDRAIARLEQHISSSGDQTVLEQLHLAMLFHRQGMTKAHQELASRLLHEYAGVPNRHLWHWLALTTLVGSPNRSDLEMAGDMAEILRTMEVKSSIPAPFAAALAAYRQGRFAEARKVLVEQIPTSMTSVGYQCVAALRLMIDLDTGGSAEPMPPPKSLRDRPPSTWLEQLIAQSLQLEAALKKKALGVGR